MAVAGPEGENDQLVLRQGLIVESKVTWGQPWVPSKEQFQEVGHRLFFTIDREDRSFARFLGLPVTQRSPWNGVCFVDHLRAARNVAADRALRKKHLLDADPFAEEEIGEAVFKKSRREMVDDMPAAIEAEVPAWQGLSQRKMRFAFPEQARARIQFELTADNLVYLQEAVHLGVDHEAESRAGNCHATPFPDECPHVHFDEKNERLSLRWKGKAKSQKQRTTKVPPQSSFGGDIEAWKNFIKPTAMRLQKKYTEEKCTEEQDAAPANDGGEAVAAAGG